MGMIINIDEALKLRTEYNVLREPLHAMMQEQQEAWERQNPIDLIFKRGTLSTFQETYTSSIGFAHAFSETSDYAVGPIFNTAEGFATTYTTRTFQGGFIISQQTLEDGQVGRVRDEATAFTKRWHGDIVEYAMKSLEGAFGYPTYYRDEDNKIGNGNRTKLQLFSADTVDGKIDTTEKNPLFFKSHTTVDREDGTGHITQSNLFWACNADETAPGIVIGGDDPAQIAKLADFINLIITNMENLKDDNGKIAGVIGQKRIVAANEPRLRAAIQMALSSDMICGNLNPAYQRATLETTAYLNDNYAFANGVGFIIVDPEYNNANHGLEFTERLPFTLDVTETKRPKGIAYDGRQRFDVNCATWRGIAYGYLGTPTSTANKWNTKSRFTALKVIDTIVKPVSVTGVGGVVNTKQAT